MLSVLRIFISPVNTIQNPPKTAQIPGPEPYNPAPCPLPYRMYQNQKNKPRQNPGPEPYTISIKTKSQKQLAQHRTPSKPAQDPGPALPTPCPLPPAPQNVPKANSLKSRKNPGPEPYTNFISIKLRLMTMFLSGHGGLISSMNCWFAEPSRGLRRAPFTSCTNLC